MLAYSGDNEEPVSARAGEPVDLRDPLADSLADSEGLLASYRPRMLKLCRRMLGDDRAEDACQDALTNAYEALPRFRDGSPVWPWLATITANVCRDMKRHDYRTVEAVRLLAAQADGVLDGDPVRQAVERGRARLVRDAVASLSPAYRVPVYLRELEGWNYTQIAELRGRSVASVRTTLMRGRRVLAARIEELARERREWPLAGFALVGDALRRLRARALARFQVPIDSAVAAASRVDSALAALTSAPLSVMAPMAAAAAAVTLVFFPSEAPATSTPRGGPHAALARPVSPTAAAAATSPSESTAAPDGLEGSEGLAVGAAQTQAGRDTAVATPPVEVAAQPTAPSDPGTADDPDGIKVKLGPSGVRCGPDDARDEAMTLVCELLDE